MITDLKSHNRVTGINMLPWTGSMRGFSEECPSTFQDEEIRVSNKRPIEVIWPCVWACGAKE